MGHFAGEVRVTAPELYVAAVATNAPNGVNAAPGDHPSGQLLTENPGNFDIPEKIGPRT
jgi:hypothetical protein